MLLHPNQPAVASLGDTRQRIPVTVIRSGAVADGFYTCMDRDGSLLNIHRCNLMPVENIPLRFRRASFERYAHVIGAALNAYPAAITVNPAPMTPESYAQPLRDAITAKARHRYTHPLIDETMFKRDAEKLCVSIADDGNIVVGPRGATPDKAQVVRGSIVGEQSSVQDTLVDSSVLDSVCLLLHQKRFAPPPSFVVSGIDDAMVRSFEERYDVAFVPHENGRAQYYRLVPPMSIDIRV